MSDIFESYKKGVGCLLEEMGEDHADYDKVLDQRHRLIENIEKKERHGDNPQLQSERNEILHNLDRLAMSTLKKPFHKLYEPKPSHKPRLNEPSDKESGNLDISEQVTSGKSDYRNLIAIMEHTIDIESPRYFTDTLMDEYVKDINAIIEWLRSKRSNAETFMGGKQAVLFYLRDARTKFILALEEYQKRGPTERFFNNIEKGRIKLEEAVMAW